MADEEKKGGKEECFPSVVRKAKFELKYAEIPQEQKDCPEPSDENVGDATAGAVEKLQKIGDKYCLHGKCAPQVPQRACKPAITDTEVVEEKNSPGGGVPGTAKKSCNLTVTVKGKISCHCE